MVLDPPLDLHERYQLHLEESKTAVSVSRLQAASELVSGFVHSDGITILTAGGKVLGYRGFIRSEAQSQTPTGGARTRAFTALTAMVGNELKAAFYRSQDGRMELKVDSEGSDNG